MNLKRSIQKRKIVFKKMIHFLRHPFQHMEHLMVKVANANDSFLRRHFVAYGKRLVHLACRGMGIMFSKLGPNFQQYNADLAQRMLEIVKNNENGTFLVGIIDIPFVGGKINGKSNACRRQWLLHKKSIMPLLNYDHFYGATNFTRRWGFIKVDLDNYRRIWNGRKVLFIIPAHGRFELDPRLFSDVSDKAFINIPPANAWDEYDTIFEAAKKYSTDWLVLISAGPTATVLAYDLYKVGYQALDIGHIAASLKEVYDGAPIPERTPFRNENE